MKVITKIAKEHNTTANEVKKEIELAIQMGFNNPDPEVQAMWKRLFPYGKQPTPEKFIEVLTKNVKRRQLYCGARTHAQRQTNASVLGTL